MALRESPAWRSLLYLPANVDRFIAKVPTSGADGVILDLEDSVAPAAKAEAREQLPARIAGLRETLAGAPPDLLVRVNAPWRLCIRDLEAAVQPGVRAIVCPKIGSADHVRAIDGVVGELEGERGLEPGGVGLIALAEQSAAYFRLPEIAAASPRLVSVMLGTEDLAAELEIDPGVEQPELTNAKFTTIMANRAAGLEPLGLAGSTAKFADLDAFEALVRRSRAMGFTGASCIHPTQVAVLNRVFTPSDPELAWARRVVEAFDQAVAGGRASVAVDGAMVDVPVFERAARMVRRAERARARA